MSNPWDNIDTTGVTFKWNEELKTYALTFDDSFNPKAVESVLKYLYTDVYKFDINTTNEEVETLKKTAERLHIKRLVQICDLFLKDDDSVQLDPSEWTKNWQWAWENLRSGAYDLSDITVICKSEDKVDRVPCHVEMLTAGSKYFHALLLNEVDSPEKKQKEIVVEDVTGAQMETLLKFIYYNLLPTDPNEIPTIWFLANRFGLTGMEQELEKLVLEKIDQTNAKDIKVIAESIQAKDVIKKCDKFSKK